MPGNWTSIDMNFPTFAEGQSVESKINAIQNYMYILTEQLKYNLNNLDATNWNSKALERLSKNITDDAIKELGSVLELIEGVSASVDNLAARLSGVSGSVASHGEKLLELEAWALEHEGKAEKHDSAIQQLQIDISFAETRLTETENQIEEINVDYWKLQGKVLVIEEDVEELRGRFRRILFSPDGSEPEDLSEGDILLMPENVNEEEGLA